MFLFGIGFIVAAYFFGTAIGGDEIPSLQLVRGTAAGVFGFPVFIIALRLAQKESIPSNIDGLLTTVPHRDAVSGLLLAEITRLIGIPLVFVVAIAISFGVGAGSIVSIVLVAFTLFSLALLGAIVGFAIGLVILVLLARVPVLARYRTAIGILFMLVYLGVFLSVEANSVFDPVVQVITRSPLGWFSDLALLAVVSDASLVHAVGAVVGLVIGFPVAFACCTWLAAQLWYSQSVEPAGEEEEPSKMGDVSIGSVPRPMALIIRKTWLRAWRSPLRLMYVPYPLIIVVPAIGDVIETGIVPPTLPPLIALYGAWATGAAFTLNPIGDEGPVLPVTLTSSIDGRSFISALCLAGLILGFPVTVIAVIVTGVLASLSPVTLVGTTIAAVVLCVCATAIASGAGVAFPRLEKASMSRNREIMVPSIFGFALYSLVLVVVSVPALLGLVPGSRNLLADGIGFGTQTLAMGGLVGTIVLGGVAGAISYYSAVGSFDNYYYD